MTELYDALATLGFEVCSGTGERGGDRMPGPGNGELDMEEDETILIEVE